MADETTKKALSLDGYIHIAEKERQIYATKTELPEVPVKSVKKNGTAITPDANGAVDVTVPTKVSDLTNDAGFQGNVIETVKVNNEALTPDAAKAVNITVPTAVTDLSDAANYALNSALGTAAAANTEAAVADDAGLPTGAAVKSFVEGKGYQTSSDVATAIENAGHTTMADVEAKGYQTAAQVGTIVEAYGYQTGTQVDTKINTAISSVHVWKGTKATVAELPSSDNKVGDTWHVTATGGEYAWDGSAWQELGTDYDFSIYMLKEDYVFASNAEIDAALGFTS